MTKSTSAGTPFTVPRWSTEHQYGAPSSSSPIKHNHGCHLPAVRPTLLRPHRRRQQLVDGKQRPAAHDAVRLSSNRRASPFLHARSSRFSSIDPQQPPSLHPDPTVGVIQQQIRQASPPADHEPSRAPPSAPAQTQPAAPHDPAGTPPSSPSPADGHDPMVRQPICIPSARANSAARPSPPAKSDGNEQAPASATHHQSPPAIRIFTPSQPARRLPADHQQPPPKSSNLPIQNNIKGQQTHLN